ncbi:voltage-gated potassium channel, partial [Ramicandelaber brevisporus]
WKRELYLLLEDPSSSHAAFLVNIFVSFMIIFSAVISTIETIPALHGDHPQLWFNFETSIVIIFTIEYLLRLVAHSNSWRSLWNHLRSVLSIVDFISIFPFYIELMMHRDTSFEFRFTILRIFRLLRVFSVFKYSSLVQLSIEVVIVAIKRSADALGALFFFMILILVIFSSLLYFVERGVWNEGERKFLTSKGEVSDFDSIPAAFWFVMVTLTTTGYGDMVPQTFIGKLISFPLMLCGILIIALPSIIVGRNFTIVWEAM